MIKNIVNIEKPTYHDILNALKKHKKNSLYDHV
jgi:hypothetical protein